MIIKEITVEVKKSYNYQTFTAGELIEIQEGDDFHVERKKAMARCRNQVMDQIKIEQDMEEMATEEGIQEAHEEIQQPLDTGIVKDGEEADDNNRYNNLSF